VGEGGEEEEEEEEEEAAADHDGRLQLRAAALQAAGGGVKCQ
jgi:hypothetical protein